MAYPQLVAAAARAYELPGDFTNALNTQVFYLAVVIAHEIQHSLRYTLVNSETGDAVARALLTIYFKLGSRNFTPPRVRPSYEDAGVFKRGDEVWTVGESGSFWEEAFFGGQLLPLMGSETSRNYVVCGLTRTCNYDCRAER
jgi:hypothetical protein